jgi:uncharacterized protein DUF6220
MSNVRAARIGFALLAWLFVALTIFQVYLAGTAVAQLGASNDFSTHQALGFVIMLIALIQLLLAFAARLGWRMVGASALLLVLMILQSALVHLNSTSLAALHPVNGFLVAVLGLWIAWRGLSFIRAPLPVEPVHVPAAATPQMAPAMESAEAPVEKPLKEDDQV